MINSNYFLCFPTHKVRAVADPGEIDVHVVAEVLEHVHVSLFVLGLAVEAVLATDVAGDGVGLSDPDFSCKINFSNSKKKFTI